MASSQGMALLVISVVVAVRHDDFAAEGWPLWSVAAASAGTVGLVCFYAALSTGTMGVVAPIASLGVVVPVLLGLMEANSRGARVGGDGHRGGRRALASGPELSGDVCSALSSLGGGGQGVGLALCLDRGARESLLHHSGECG